MLALNARNRKSAVASRRILELIFVGRLIEGACPGIYPPAAYGVAVRLFPPR